MNQKQILNELYVNPNFPSAYSGDLKKFLLEKESLSRHKQKKHVFKRRKVFVSGPFSAIQADTVFYRGYSRQNNGFKYVLAVVDIFSRKNWVRKMRTTSAEETATNLNDIISSMPYKPTRFASDQGSEFSATHPAIFDVLVGKYINIHKLR